MIEHDVEAHLLFRCRQVGFLCLKLVSPSRNGVPDRIVVTPQATVFVEVKRPRERPRRNQLEMHSKIRRFGGRVHVVDTVVGVDRLVDRLADRKEAARLAS
ncbi:MAG: VRR-NUC domain-containing protein [Propionibacteriaceae bacterium]